MGDSTRGSNMESIGKEEYIFDSRFYLRYYDLPDVEDLLKAVGVVAESLELSRWTEPPHEGYREYPHDHESWGLHRQEGQQPLAAVIFAVAGLTRI
jgi:hypothetical protein